MKKYYGMLNLSLLIANIFITAIGQIFLKNGALKITEIKFRSLISNFSLLTGVSLYGLSFVLWIVILKRLPLSTAYPALSLGYILVTFLSAKFFGETFTLGKISGVFFVILGVWLLFKY
jgi:multidrug transporter EmrE-like cation transporter